VLRKGVRYTLRAAPRPQAIVRQDGEPNAWVSSMPVVENLPARVAPICERRILAMSTRDEGGAPRRRARIGAPPSVGPDSKLHLQIVAKDVSGDG
jgi:hypothetical protein